MTNTAADLPPATRRHMLRSYQALRLVGFLILAAGVAWLLSSEGGALWPSTLAMALGAAVAWTGVFWLARFETLRDASTRRAVRLLVAGFGLKILAIPLVAVGGTWLAWTGSPGLAVAIGVAGLGFAAYVAGIIVRIDGLARLPSGAHYA